MLGAPPERLCMNLLRLHADPGSEAVDPQCGPNLLAQRFEALGRPGGLFVIRRADEQVAQVAPPVCQPVDVRPELFAGQDNHRRRPIARNAHLLSLRPVAHRCLRTEARTSLRSITSATSKRGGTLPATGRRRKTAGK